LPEFLDIVRLLEEVRGSQLHRPDSILGLAESRDDNNLDGGIDFTELRKQLQPGTVGQPHVKHDDLWLR
jgi:hypothetical protein